MASLRSTELLGDEEEKLDEFKQHMVIIYIIYEPLVVLADTTYKEADSKIAGKIQWHRWSLSCRGCLPSGKIRMARQVTIFSWRTHLGSLCSPCSAARVWRQWLPCGVGRGVQPLPS